MGVGSYFKSGAKPKPKPAAAAPVLPNTVSAMPMDLLSPPQTGYDRHSSGSNLSLRSNTSTDSHLEEIKHKVMVNFLYQQQCSRMWIGSQAGRLEGALVRKSRNSYLACPPDLARSAFHEACLTLNVQVAITVHSRVIQTFLQAYPKADDVPLNNGLRVQVVPSMNDLHRARKHQFAAFVAEEGLLVVWDDDAMQVITRASQIETELMNLIWRQGQPVEEESNEKKVVRVAAVEIDEESGEVVAERRPVHLLNAMMVSLTIMVIGTTVGASCRQLAIECKIDHQYWRLALIAAMPFQVFFSLFFARVVVGCVFQIIGPVRQMTTNSRYYSANPPARLRSRALPHITIQCPVYKEGLHSVVAPTVRSIKQAISTYELQGGSANIFINDDGIQLLNEADRQERIDFYADHNIGWVGRPRHNVDGFVRRGKFKKASNMNYALMISCRIEEKLAQIPRTESWNHFDESVEYERCLKEVLESEGRAWADGNVRLGDYILLIDSDTRVPTDCLLDAVSEMEQSPEVGILQFSSGVMKVVHTYFENGIAFFTDLVYTAIRYAVSNGDCAPFVGHNAILRWTAIQQVSYQDEDRFDKFWSESHVSEDFDMSLRLQIHGYTVRLAAWAGDGFKEGVSLTVYDELARWEKYAYGCNELLFNPVRLWLVRGPFTKLFRRFLFSNIHLSSKITIIAYIGTYYAIAAAWLLTAMNYLLVGWYHAYLDKFYIDSWQVWFSIVIVFNGISNISLAILRYRTNDQGFWRSLWDNFKWVPMLALFLGGLSLHVSQAMFAHMFEINMQWGATAKERVDSSFFIEVPKILKRFKLSFLLVLLATTAMIVLAKASFIPPDFRITDFVAILPLASILISHFLLPIALNPDLMTFSF
ncbi:MAG: hypothetical protein M1826_001164 [Phylliscum demangeonii]|nr:MAG: hypothetical protein M1826_001164 [Phylliscum demangeonii]